MSTKMGKLTATEFSAETESFFNELVEGGQVVWNVSREKYYMIDHKNNIVPDFIVEGKYWNKDDFVEWCKTPKK